MSNIKQAVIDVLAKLPDDCTYEDVQYQLYVRERIEKGIKDVDEGRHIPHNEAKARFQEWLRSIGHQQPSKTSPVPTNT